MSSKLPPEDQPLPEWRRPTTPGEAAAAVPEYNLADPNSVAKTFFTAIQDVSANQDILPYFITPESRSAWGDFTEAAEMLAAIENVGIGIPAHESHSDPLVVYANIRSGVTSSYHTDVSDQFFNVAAVITLVWRPDFDRWMVHHMGDYVLPEDVPHG